ncbi:monovalent cation/H+ antiporter complex subunit F [Cellulomonas wangsupingiae]|uniref:Monovalent cation/H+ antiporter complex subunit F n=1 Tax=Cellulomonas wangsupingiae TaxID=2968085 RepID=A0ABY5K4H7_9CELL|nr:monovalent cation/H+ antiporter complex subunit F [Cellulomonas wangsupingiae]MCC2334870.1 pH regulation protein F [Cellulomonas wangsupingiae]MCM0638743.1 monovalent cation/H+ antiporter complex subunit F [Cellulomonas wangsupingiae]UUI65371.1 monovalent cation/H+ antiporter complex subunit F [Cellulomonas wangsupingiae]
MSPFDVVVVACSVLLTLGAVLAIVRAEKGPSMLDRTIALDIVVTTMIAGIALYAAYFRRADVVPLLVVLSLVGFVGSVTVARFAAVEPEGEGRVRTREEVAAEEAEKRRLEQEEEESRRRRRHAAESEALAAADGAGAAGPVPEPPAGTDEPTPHGSRATVEPEPDDEHHGGPADEETR